jgi:amino acid transporter
LKKTTGLSRQMGLVALTATGVCSMMGASINVVPFMIQKNVPGIGPYVIPAFAFAAIPALFAALAYAMLASAMPRAGGSYVYASRGLNPYLGFIASFSQWFGLSIVIGVIAYIVVPFVRDIAISMGLESLAGCFENNWVRVSLSLTLIWLFVYVNVRGTKSYENTLIPMMVLMLVLGSIVIIAGFSFNTSDFLAGLQEKEGRSFTPDDTGTFDIQLFLSAAALLFSSFIGFDAIAQAGGEAINPTKNLPRAILLAIVGVGGYYLLFSSAVYHAVPWSFVALEAKEKHISAPGLLRYVIPSGLTVAVLTGAAIALINDLPAMLLSVSRLMFAWAEDGIFPRELARVHPVAHTPYPALIAAGTIASFGVLGSHFAGDFFLGIDIMVTSMMVNFLLMCITLLTIPTVNPGIAKSISIIRGRKWQRFIGISGTVLLMSFLVIHIYKDLTMKSTAWYFHSTIIWVLVMFLATLIFLYRWNRLKDRKSIFSKLPEE